MTPMFISALEAEKLPAKPRKWWQVWDEPSQWRLVIPLRFQSDIYGGVIEVPAGFVTDFASVPRLPLAYLVAGDTAHEAAVVHDYLYQTHKCPREKADAILSEGMGATFEPAWRRDIIWAAVRVCGWVPYRSGPKRLLILGNLK